ncbi:MAG: hypothetical protein EOM23_12200 [Candidatus Moranbacteria bacterium]|nr:hypothetical protein [Candidatus Moranbacteria bacterium]
MNQLTKALRMFKDRRIILFACAGNKGVQKDIDDIIKKNFKNNELSIHQFFYLPGGVDFSKITGIQRKMLDFFRKMVEKKPNRTPEEEDILKGFTEPTNYVERRHIDELVEYARTLYRP